MHTKTAPSLSCSTCGASPALTESLAAPQVATTRVQYEQRLSIQASAFTAEKQAVNAKGEADRRRAAEFQAAARRHLEDVARVIQERVQKHIVSESTFITEQESARARQQVEDALRAGRGAATSQSEGSQAPVDKLIAAQAKQADLLNEGRLLGNRARDLTPSKSRRPSWPVSPKRVPRLSTKRRLGSISRCRIATPSTSMPSPALRYPPRPRRSGRAAL